MIALLTPPLLARLIQSGLRGPQVLRAAGIVMEGHCLITWQCPVSSQCHFARLPAKKPQAQTPHES